MPATVRRSFLALKFLEDPFSIPLYRLVRTNVWVAQLRERMAHLAATRPGNPRFL